MLSRAVTASGNLRRWCWGLYALSLCGILLYPFDFHLPWEPEIQWLHDERGVRFAFTAGIRSSVPPLRLYEEIVTRNRFSVELWAAPAGVDQGGPARVVSYSTDKLNRNFTIGQDGDTLVVRLRATGRDFNGQPELRIGSVFSSTGSRHVVLVFDSGTERVYVDGEKRAEVGGLGDLSNWDASYPFLLGNEATGNRTWLGRVFLVAVYSRPLSDREILSYYRAGHGGPMDRNDGVIALYTFQTGSGDQVTDRSGRVPPLPLEIVGSHEMTGSVPLFPPSGGSWFTWRIFLDSVANILIFLPFGSFLAVSLRGRFGRWGTVMAVAGVALGFSVAVELVQYLSWVRTSSWLDVVNNSVGAAMGAAAIHLPRFSRGDP